MSSSVTTGGTGVEAAPVTPEVVQAHGLTEPEYAEIRRLLGRAPNLTELGVFSVMWSEHCSYKSSRKHLKQLPTEGARVIHGPGENAGVMDIGDGLAVVFKIESHNHPSFIEPYQGAATGVGGILRDIFTMGARPIASLNSLRFGSVRHPKTPYLVKRVVGGIGGYGNCIGVPTVGGEITFDECYDANILVNAFTLGLVERDRIFTGKAQGSGNPVMYVGSKTGRDGVHGATMGVGVLLRGFRAAPAPRCRWATLSPRNSSSKPVSSSCRPMPSWAFRTWGRRASRAPRWRWPAGAARGWSWSWQTFRCGSRA